jgi:hypothetical protein
VNRKQRVAFGYVFQRSQFPWVTIWEENRARTAPPWRGQEQARAFEFGVSPLPIGRGETLRNGAIFGTPTLIRIPARATVSAAWLMFLCRVPRTMQRVDDIVCEHDGLRLAAGAGKTHKLPAASIADFFNPALPQSSAAISV